MTRVYAQPLELPHTTGEPPTIISGPPGMDSWLPKEGGLGAIVSRALPFVFAFAGIGLLLMILAAGFKLLTSAGDAKKLEQGQQQLTQAILGFLIIFSAYWLVQIAGKIFGLAEIQNVFQ